MNPGPWTSESVFTSLIDRDLIGDCSIHLALLCYRRGTIKTHRGVDRRVSGERKHSRVALNYQSVFRLIQRIWVGECRPRGFLNLAPPSAPLPTLGLDLGLQPTLLLEAASGTVEGECGCAAGPPQCPVLQGRTVFPAALQKDRPSRPPVARRLWSGQQGRRTLAAAAGCGAS